MIIVGASPAPQRIIGYTLEYKLATASKCPMIIIRDLNTDFSMNSILLLISNSALTRQKVPHAATLALKFNSTVHIVLLTKKTEKTAVDAVRSYGRQTERYLAERSVKYTVSESFGVDPYYESEKLSKKVNSDIALAMVEEKGTIFRKDRNLCLWVKNGQFTLMIVPALDSLEKEQLSS